ncbi:NADH-quinone oxidoreductase subunit C [Streptomyces sp. NPDC048577]|uniref:NADH-quinone oxidoreductase subunit C n=1 Tax=Streptomyces sp. NPDC048577 TaxID=3157209 RepID=UPI00342F9CCB
MTGNAHPYDTLPDAVTELFGEEATAERAYDLLTVDVPADAWTAALETARTTLGCTFFDWLSAVDEPGTGFRVCAHVVAPEPGAVRRMLLRTTVPHDAPVLPTAVAVYAGADWHERETHEMFGVVFTGHPHLVPLLLPENFEGHPLRKDFVLAARVAKAWPGAKEPGESEHGGPKRRQMLPPGVPDPNEWGPLKGQLPPAPARTSRAAGDRPARRARTAAEGPAGRPGTPAAPSEGAPAAPARRARSAAEGSVSQTAGGPESAPPSDSAAAPAPGRRSRSASQGSATQRAAAPAADGAVDQPAPAATPPLTRGADAPWHHPRPAFDDKDAQGTPAPAPEPDAAPRPAAQAPSEADTEADPRPAPDDPSASPPTTDPAGGDPA